MLGLKVQYQMPGTNLSSFFFFLLVITVILRLIASCDCVKDQVMCEMLAFDWVSGGIVDLEKASSQRREPWSYQEKVKACY